MTLTSPKPNPDQLSYLAAEMKMTNAHVRGVGWLSGGSWDVAEAPPWAGPHPLATEGLPWTGPCPWRKGLLSAAPHQALSPPCAGMIPSHWFLERVKS